VRNARKAQGSGGLYLFPIEKGVQPVRPLFSTIVLHSQLVLRFGLCQTFTMDTAYVTSKGQLVVPSRIRRRYGIKPGTRINFIEDQGRIIFQPVTPEYIDSFCGVFKQKPGEKSVVREHLEERRAERKKENRK